MVNSVTSPLPRIAMVGGGQLARMTHQAVISLGQQLRILATSPDEPAAQVASDVVIGSHDDLEALRQVATGATVLTFDHEHVPNDLLYILINEHKDIRIAPHPQALIYAQNKITMRHKLGELNLPIPQFCVIDNLQNINQIDHFHDLVQSSIVIKAAYGGYDGRGVDFSDSPAESHQKVKQYLHAGVPVLLEEKITMRRELSALVARSPFGQGAAWPIVQTIQHEGICIQVIAPAPDLSEHNATYAQQLALSVAEKLQVTGVLAVELFETDEGRILINELAMRPHNSGHWTMNGSITSQFEQHARAILDYPLGDTTLTAPVTVMVNILGADQQPSMCMDERLHHLYARMPDAHVHLYGKTERPGRKIGHINFCGNSIKDWQQLAHKADIAAQWLAYGTWADGWDPHE